MAGSYFFNEKRRWGSPFYFDKKRMLYFSQNNWLRQLLYLFIFGSRATRAFGKRYGGERFSFRQINIRCRDVLAAGDPSLALYEGVLQSECDALLELARSPEA